MKLEQMQPEHLERIERLFHAALERDENERDVFLAEACAGDESLRAEVLSLLGCDARADDFIEAPVLEVAAQLQTEEQESLMIGRRLGPYQILDLIGAGGMGEVYRAMDTRLGREVAIKVLPSHLAQDPAALARFKREVRAVAALSHPNILTLYDFGDEEDICFAVMELLEGETLRGRIAQSPLAWREVMEIGLAAAEGMSAAHAKGIIHRDLKPENIFLTSDGQVKILDFGLARVKPLISAPVNSLARTAPGIVFGTVGYMSPEQVRGEEADAPSDIFSVGCMLYEAMTGQRPFAGPTPQETMAAILKDDPPKLLAKLPKPEVEGKKISLELERIINRCLEKQPTARYQSAQDLAGELKAVLNSSNISIRPLARGLPRSRRAVWITAILTSLIVVTALYLWLRLGIGMGRWIEQKTEHGQPVLDEIDSIAVLPFKPLVANSRDESFEVGMAETLIIRLSSIRELTVRPMSAVRKYDALEQDSLAAGREQRVDAVLDGNIQKTGERVRVTVRLVRVSDGKTLWAEKFDERLANIFALQDSISERVATAMAVKLTSEERQLLTRHHTDSTQAYQLYLKGRLYYKQWTEEGIQKALACFDKAIAIDPNYALAYAGKADVYSANASVYLPPAEAMSKAKRAAQRALEIDDRLADAHHSMANIKQWSDWDWSGAEDEFKRALLIKPNAVETRLSYSSFLILQKRFGEARVELKRAQEFDPISLTFSHNMGKLLYLTRQYEQAIAQYRETVALYPNMPEGYRGLGLALRQQGMYQEAIAELQKAVDLQRRENYLSELGYTYALSGRLAEAINLVKELEGLSQRRYVSPINVARIYAGFGEKDRVFKWLRKGYEDRSDHLLILGLDPSFDSVRSDPRFTDLLRRIGLAP